MTIAHDERARVAGINAAIAALEAQLDDGLAGELAAQRWKASLLTVALNLRALLDAADAPDVLRDATELVVRLRALTGRVERRHVHGWLGVGF